MKYVLKNKSIFMSACVANMIIVFPVFVRPGSDGKAELVILDHGLYQPLETRYIRL